MSLFKNRKPKRVGGKDDVPPEQDVDGGDIGPVVRRPATNAPKNKSKLRMSFDPAETDGQNLDSTSLKRPHTALRPSTSQSLINNGLQDLPARSLDVLSHDRPTYSKDYLNQLRNSTPSTPKDLSTYNSSAEEDAEITALDVAGKFGQSRISSSSAIPSAAEIQEKKDRRARLAKEQGADDFIPLEDYDSDGEFKPQRMQVSKFYERDQAKDTRLVRDDEDIAEGFDSFVDDPGRVTLSNKLRRLQERKERDLRRELVNEAEHSSSDDDSEAERNDAYVAAQTAHGMDGLRSAKLTARPKPPKEFAAIPKLGAVLARLRGNVQALEMEKAKLQKRKADVARERVEVVARQEHIQTLLTEAGEKFEELRNEAQRKLGDEIGISAVNGNANGGRMERRLDGLTGTTA